MNTSFLVPVFSGSFNTQTELLCNARDLHKALQVRRDFSNWIKGRIEEYGFVYGIDFIRSPNLASDLSSSSNGNNSKRGGQNKIEYHLTLNMAKELAMVEKTEVGRQVRKYFIECERERFIGMQHKAISHLISKEQADTIQRAVEERGNRTGEPYQKIYAGLHAYLSIDSYKTMPVEHFTAAIKYLSSIENAPELIKQSDEVLVHLGNLKALIYHMDWCFCWFQFVYKSLRHLNNDLVVPMIDKFGDGHLSAGLLAYPLGIKMLPLQEMYYFPWEKDAKTQDSYWENYVKRNMICRPYFSMK